MDARRLFKLAVIVALLIFGWKMLGPRIQSKLDSAGSPSTAGAGSACADRAAGASDAWGRGLARFVNPPVDLDAWGSFRAGVEAQISLAQAACGCAEESCRQAKSALSDLRSLIAEFDTAARSGMAPPSDAVQRQEAIDEAITSAGELARAGR